MAGFWMYFAFTYVPESDYSKQYRAFKQSVMTEFNIQTRSEAHAVVDSLIQIVAMHDTSKSITIPDAVSLYGKLKRLRSFGGPRRADGYSDHVKYLAFTLTTGLKSGLRISTQSQSPENAKKIHMFRRAWQEECERQGYDDFAGVSFWALIKLAFKWACIISVIGIMYMLLTHPCLKSTVFRKPHYLFFQIVFWPLCLSKEMNPFEQLDGFRSTYRSIELYADETVSSRIIERATWICLERSCDIDVAIKLARDRSISIKKPLLAGLLVWMLSLSVISIRSHQAIPTFHQVVVSLCIDTLSDDTHANDISLMWFFPVSVCILVISFCIKSITFHVLSLYSIFYGYSFLVRGPPTAAIVYRYSDMPLVATSE